MGAVIYKYASAAPSVSGVVVAVVVVVVVFVVAVVVQASAYTGVVGREVAATQGKIQQVVQR